MARLWFWIAAGFPVYIYFGYPILLWGLHAIFRSSASRQSVEPSVSLLVAAYNEAAVIADKLRNGLALDYPDDSLEIVVASDGSEGRHRGNRAFSGRVGITRTNSPCSTSQKIAARLAVLNDAIPQLRGEIVAFSDASSMLAKDSLRIWFKVCSEPRRRGQRDLSAPE